MATTVRSLTNEVFCGWNAIALRQGPLRLHVVPQVGGRLMGIEFDGRPLCFVHPDLHGRVFDSEAAWPALCGGWTFPLWGGGKTWLAPESDWPDGAPHRDLDSGAWELLGGAIDEAAVTVALQSPVCGRSGLQLTRRLRLTLDGSWCVEHEVRNRSARTQRVGLWDVLMLNRPGEVVLPLPPTAPDGPDDPVVALPGHPPLAELQRRGLLAVDTGREARVRCSEAVMFKCGFASEAGRLRVDFDGLRYERQSAVPAGSCHAHGRPLEVFNAPSLPYFEVETHSPLATLVPGGVLRYEVTERVGTR